MILPTYTMDPETVCSQAQDLDKTKRIEKGKQKPLMATE